MDRRNVKANKGSHELNQLPVLLVSTMAHDQLLACQELLDVDDMGILQKKTW